MKNSGSTQLTIDAISTNRCLMSYEGIDDLAKDIETRGLKTPILVRRSGLLIDGLRRMTAMAKLGREKIPAIVTDDLDEICTYLAEMPRDISPRRIYEIYAATISVAHARKVERLASGMSNKEPLPESEYYTPKLLRALGIRSRNTLGRATQVFRLADAGDAVAIKLAAQLDAGEITVGVAEGRLRDAYGMRGHIVNASEQKQLIENSMRTLSGVVLALESMGSPINIKDKDLSRLIESVRSHKMALDNFIRRFITQAERKMMTNE